MSKSEINATTLAAVLAAALIARYAPTTLEPWVLVVVGVLLTLLLFAFDRAGYRAISESTAYGGIAGFCVLTAILGGLSLAHFLLPAIWNPLIWLAASIVLIAIDRARVEPRRAPREIPAAAVAPLIAEPKRSSRPASIIPLGSESVPMAPPPPPPPPPSRPQVAPPLPPSPATEETVFFPKAASRPAAPPPQPPAPPPAAAPPRPAAVAIPPGAGKPATIYLNIVDAGLSCLRAVKAEHLGRDFYRITEPTPADEKWEFATGQIVRCQKKTLSSGKAMVAVEEAPRAS